MFNNVHFNPSELKNKSETTVTEEAAANNFTHKQDTEMEMIVNQFGFQNRQTVKMHASDVICYVDNLRAECGITVPLTAHNKLLSISRRARDGYLILDIHQCEIIDAKFSVEATENTEVNQKESPEPTASTASESKKVPSENDYQAQFTASGVDILISFGCFCNARNVVAVDEVVKDLLVMLSKQEVKYTFGFYVDSSNVVTRVTIN